jgi:maltose alpha-D-glucosyltransferase/alpha-amylase
MQWSAGHNGGFSAAPTEQLVRQMVTEPAYAHARVNVANQLRDSASLLSWFHRLVAVRYACPELGAGEYRPLTTLEPGLLAFMCTWRDRVIMCAHNFGDTNTEMQLNGLINGPVQEVWSDRRYPAAGLGDVLPIDGHGYRWLRLNIPLA